MRAVVVMLFLCAARLAGAATPVTVDVTDLWWSPTASGRGVNIVQQSNTLFATFFVYGADGRAHWYVSPDMRTGGGPRDTELTFLGTLYDTTGPALFTPFHPEQARERTRNRATWARSAAATAAATAARPAPSR